MTGRSDTYLKDIGWKGGGHWLGTSNVSNRARKMRPFKEARGFVRNLRLKSSHEWELWSKGEHPRVKMKRPIDIPSTPHKIYKDAGWKGIADWLGN